MCGRDRTDYFFQFDWTGKDEVEICSRVNPKDDDIELKKKKKGGEKEKTSVFVGGAMMKRTQQQNRPPSGPHETLSRGQ